MRILHVTPQYHPALGGSETYTKEISERLARRGHDVTVLTMHNNGDGLASAEVINEVKVNRFRPAGRGYDLFKLFLSLPGAERLLGPAMGADKLQMFATSPYGLRPGYVSVRTNPDVVAVINWYGGWLAYQICLARRIRDFALVGIPLFHTECSWSHAGFYGEMLERCDVVVALTEHERHFVEQRCTRNNARAVGVGVNPLLFANADGNQIRARHGIGDAPLVGYVGRMVPSKGVVTVIEAMKRVWLRNPTVRLLLAGSGLSTASNAQDEVARAFRGLSDAERSRVIVINRFSDGEKASVFDALDLFVMPSIAESFGIAYLEAWMCKKAVIGSRIGSTQCVIEDGVDGVLVNPGGAGELAGAILRLLADRSTRERMGKLGYEKTMNSFTWDQITNQIEHIYHQANPQTSKPRSTISVEGPLPGESSRSRWA